MIYHTLIHYSSFFGAYWEGGCYSIIKSSDLVLVWKKILNKFLFHLSIHYLTHHHCIYFHIVLLSYFCENITYT